MAGRTNAEQRIFQVETAITAILQKIAKLEEMIRKALENSMRGGGGDGGLGNGNTVYGVITTAVVGRTATNLGFGFALIDGDYNFTTGAITAGAGTPVKFWTRWSGTKPIGGIVELDFRRGQWWEQGFDCP